MNFQEIINKSHILYRDDILICLLSNQFKFEDFENINYNCTSKTLNLFFKPTQSNLEIIVNADSFTEFIISIEENFEEYYFIKHNNILIDNPCERMKNF